MSKEVHFQLATDEHCIYAVVSGSWDDLIAKQFCKVFLNEVQHFNGKPFCHLVYFDQFTFGIPEIVPIIQKLVDTLMANEMRFVAQVIPKSHYNLTQFQLQQMTQTKGLFEKQSFTEIVQAEAWLKLKFKTISDTCNYSFQHEIVNRYKNEL